MFEEGEIVVDIEKQKRKGYIAKPIGKYDTQAHIWWITNEYGRELTGQYFRWDIKPILELMKAPEIDVIFPDMLKILIDEALAEGNKAEFTRLSKLLGGDVVGQA